MDFNSILLLFVSATLYLICSTSATTTNVTTESSDASTTKDVITMTVTYSTDYITTSETLESGNDKLTTSDLARTISPHNATDVLTNRTTVGTLSSTSKEYTTTTAPDVATTLLEETSAVRETDSSSNEYTTMTTPDVATTLLEVTSAARETDSSLTEYTTMTPPDVATTLVEETSAATETDDATTQIAIFKGKSTSVLPELDEVRRAEERTTEIEEVVTVTSLTEIYATTTVAPPANTTTNATRPQTQGPPEDLLPDFNNEGGGMLRQTTPMPPMQTTNIEITGVTEIQVTQRGDSSSKEIESTTPVVDTDIVTDLRGIEEVILTTVVGELETVSPEKIVTTGAQVPLQTGPPGGVNERGDGTFPEGEGGVNERGDGTFPEGEGGVNERGDGTFPEVKTTQLDPTVETTALAQTSDTTVLETQTELQTDDDVQTTQPEITQPEVQTTQLILTSEDKTTLQDLTAEIQTTQSLDLTTVLESDTETQLDLTTVLESDTETQTALTTESAPEGQTTLPEVIAQMTQINVTTEIPTTVTPEIQTTLNKTSPVVASTAAQTSADVQTTRKLTTQTTTVQKTTEGELTTPKKTDLPNTAMNPPTPILPEKMSEEARENTISLVLADVNRDEWFGGMNKDFVKFIANITGVNTWNIVFVAPTPMFGDDGKLHLTFVISNDEGCRRRRDANGSGSYMDSEAVTKLIEENIRDLATTLNISIDNIEVFEGPSDVVQMPAVEPNKKTDVPNEETDKPKEETSEPKETPKTEKSGKGDTEKESIFYVVESPGLFIALIVIIVLSVVVITVGLIYLLCDRRRSTRGEYITNSINKDLDLGIDNPAMLQDKSMQNGNGAHLISIKHVDEQDIVPYDSFTQEEIMNCEVEDTHL